TVAQLETLLDTGRKTYAANGDRRARDLAAADALYGSDKNAEAAKAYAAALATAPPGWSELPRVVDAYLFTLSQSDQYATCAEAARTYFPRLASVPSAANVAASGLDCATSIPKDQPGRAALIDALERDCLAVLADRRLRISGDDRSGVYQSLYEAREDAGDAPGAKRRLTEWITFLEHAAATAKTPEARAVFDSHRLSA